MILENWKKISGKEFEFLVDALNGQTFGPENLNPKWIINALSEHLEDVHITDVIAAETVGMSPKAVKRRCNIANHAASHLYVWLRQKVLAMSAEEIALLAALVLGCNIQRSANFLETSLGIAWEEEVYLSEPDDDVIFGDETRRRIW